MATYSKLVLSGSSNGRPIKVVATTTPGTLIHTAVAGTLSFDEVWLYANNTSPDPVSLTIEFGGVSSPDDQIIVGIPARQGLVLIIPGITLQNSLEVRAFAASVNVVNISGWINRIS